MSGGDVSIGAVEYSFREHAFVSDSHWSIDGETLTRTDKAGATHFPLIEAAGLRLAFDPTRVSANRYRCVLRFRDGRAVTLVNLSYRGFADFEDRSQAWTAIVNALLTALARINPGCPCYIGKPWVSFILNILLMTMGLLLLFFVAVTIGIPLMSVVLAKLALLAWLIPTAIQWIRKNKPRALRPEAIIATGLPALLAAGSIRVSASGARLIRGHRRERS